MYMSDTAAATIGCVSGANPEDTVGPGEREFSIDNLLVRIHCISLR